MWRAVYLLVALVRIYLIIIPLREIVLNTALVSLFWSLFTILYSRRKQLALTYDLLKFTKLELDGDDPLQESASITQVDTTSPMVPEIFDSHSEIANKLRQFPTHTTYYNSFFLLRTEVVLNGQPAEIGWSDSCELSLSCRYFPIPNHPTTKHSISIPSISAKIEYILKNHGVYEVCNFFYVDYAPLFQVSFCSERGLKEFLQNKEKVEKDIATLLSTVLQPCSTQSAQKQQAEAPVVSCSIPSRVNASLFLMKPDPATKDCAKPTEVSLENYSSLIAIWKESEVFDFGDVFRASRLNPEELPDEGEISLTAVLQELLEVFEWFILGSYLGVPEHELETIRLDHVNSNKECKLKMINTWIKLGNASWSALVRALWDIGRCGLAKKIAYKYGATLPPAALNPQAKPEQKEVSVVNRHGPKQSDQSSVQCQLLFSIEHHDHRLEDKNTLVETAMKNKSKASEKQTHVKRHLSAALSDVDQLHEDKKNLTKQLKSKEKALHALETMNEQQGEFEESIELLKQEIQQLQDALDEKDRKIAGMTQKADHLKPQLQEATAELLSASSDFIRFKTEQEALRIELEKERLALERVQYDSDTIKELKGDLTAMEKASHSKTEEIGTLQGKLLSQNEEVMKLQKDLHEAEQRKPALTEQRSGAAVQQQILQIMETTELKVKVAQAEEKKQEVENQLGTLQKQVEYLEDKIIQESQKVSDPSACLPEPLIRKQAEAVAFKGGVASIEVKVYRLPELLTRNREILEETLRMLAEEEREDTKFRNRFRERWSRESSSKLNANFKKEAKSFKETLDSAAQIDAGVREKYNTNRDSMELLGKPLDEISAALPQAGSSLLKSQESESSLQRQESRESKLKDLATAGDAFMELRGKLTEGINFYDKLTPRLIKFQEEVSDFVFARKTEKDELLKEMQMTQPNRPGTVTYAPGSSSPTYQHQTPGVPPSYYQATSPTNRQTDTPAWGFPWNAGNTR